MPRILQWLALSLLLAPAAQASDHLDTPSVIADPRTDIGDLFAWMSPDAKRLNLVMAIVGHGFSDTVTYEFHIDSGRRFGTTHRSTSITCRFPQPDTVDCKLGRDRVAGNAGVEQGLTSRKGLFRVFAGLRDDPFFNNVVGTRNAYQAALAALKAGTPVDAGQCPAFDTKTVAEIRDRWRHVNDGPASNFLKGWTPASLVVSVDIATINQGGSNLAVWATTGTDERWIDRMGRPLTGNALLGTLAGAEVSNRMKEEYNAAKPAEWQGFAPEIARNLGLYDGFDGICGNGFLADREAAPARRYDATAALLADDRLWINAESGQCRHFAAVELAAVGGREDLAGDCGGRTPNVDAVDIYRSLLVNGTENGIDDGVDQDEKPHSDSAFPFLARP
ncbi:DUF4331 family protein [Niveispirillum sp. KHB5.9]|uniref:DUF4331 family protein n=1 Tax=Niveispirillum sp. KHB5.9 TaxID=3400269 RepID=UPI003A87F173